MVEVCEATAGEIDAVVEAMIEPPASPKVEIDRGYQNAISRARLSTRDESTTIPLPIVRTTMVR